MSTAIKCKRCGRFIFRNANGLWLLPKTKLSAAMCIDGDPHEPDNQPPGGPSPSVTGIAVSIAVVDVGLF